MKKILFCLLSVLVFSISKSQTHLTAPLVRNNPADNTYSTHIDSLGFGGFMALTDTVNRNNIPIAQRKQGMVAVTNDSLLWQLQGGVSNINWVLIFSGHEKDTVHVGHGLNVIWDSTGHQLLYADYADGLIEGGLVTYSGTGLIYDITPAQYVINHKIYSSPQMQVTLSASDPTFSTQYIFVVDTNNVATFVRGTPASLPLEPQIDVFSQIALTSGITILAGATTPPTMYIVNIFDENLSAPSEFTPTTAATITVNFNNTDNPYHLTKAAFVSSYATNGKLFFTSSSIDSIHNGEVLSLWVYLNIPLGANRFYFGFYNGATAVTNLFLFNNTNGLNPNLTGQYQHVVIPLSTFTWSNIHFDKLVIIMNGNDLSGAGGFYLDYLQLQTGINNIPPQTDYSNKQDSNHVSHDSLFQYHKGIPGYLGQLNGSGGGGNDTAIVTHTLAPDSSYSVDVHANRSIHLPNDTLRLIGSTTGGSTERFGIEDNLGLQDRSVDMQGFNFTINNSPEFYVNTGTVNNGQLFLWDKGTILSTTHSGFESYDDGFSPVDNLNMAQMYGQNNTGDTAFYIRALQNKIQFTTNIPSGSYAITLAQISADHYLPLSVNGNYADSVGNITVSAGVDTSSWHKLGNSGTSTSNFFGTTDNQPIRFKVNSNQAGFVGTTTTHNIALGLLTLPEATTGTKNIGIGGGALGNNTNGNNNVAIGYTTLFNNKTGSNNTGYGWSVLGFDSSGTGNTAVGTTAMGQTGGTLHIGGSYNSAFGFQALKDNFNNNFNIGLGYQSGTASSSSNTMYISDSTTHLYMKLDSATGSAPNIVSKDGLGNWHVYANSGAGVTTASNGLTVVGSDVRLGGTLSANTTITASTNTLTINGSVGSGVNQLHVFTSGSFGRGIFGESTTGYGIYGTGGFVGVFGGGSTTNSYGVLGSNTGSSGFGGSFSSSLGIGLVGSSDTASAAWLKVTRGRIDTITTAIRLSKYTVSTNANAGIGVSADFEIATDAGAGTFLSNQIVSKWTDPSNATKTSELSFSGYGSATFNKLLTLSGNGAALLNKYASRNFYHNDTTNYKPVIIDNSGNIAQGSWSGSGGGSGLATASNGLTAVSSDVQLFGSSGTPATLTSDRYLTAADKTLNITFNSLAGSSGLNLSTTSTAAASNLQKMIEISMSGANPTSGQSTYGIYATNNHTGTTAINYAGYFIISGIGSGVYGEAGSSGTGASGFNSGTGNGVAGSTTNGTGVFGSSSTGTAISANSNSGLPLNTFMANTTNNNDVNVSIQMDRTTISASGANGIGQSMRFFTQTGSGTRREANTIVSKWTDAADLTRTSEFSITGVNSATTQTLLTLSGNGNALFGGTVQLKNYTVSTLPTGVRGMTAYVTDALTPTFGTTLVGGGSVVAKAFFDGTNWINE